MLLSLAPNTIWTFWDGNPPDIVLRCVESMRLHNPHRPVAVVSKSNLFRFLEPDDYPLFHGRRGTPEDFSCAQYLSDWVRLTLLEKFGGVWLDASVICTNPVESWVPTEQGDETYRDTKSEKDVEDNNKLVMFPMHANPNIHGNWAMAAVKPGHPMIRAWKEELAAVFNEVGPGAVPEEYCIRMFQEYPALEKLWNFPSPPPLPYLWVYLTLQVVLQKRPELHSTILVRSCIDGPMYRRYLINVLQGVTDIDEVSEQTALHLATFPLDLEGNDRYFIKLVGKDRDPCQKMLESGNFVPGSVLCMLSKIRPRSIEHAQSPASAIVARQKAVTQLQATIRVVVLVAAKRSKKSKAKPVRLQVRRSLRRRSSVSTE